MSLYAESSAVLAWLLGELDRADTLTLDRADLLTLTVRTS
jgi:hypothetical protein